MQALDNNFFELYKSLDNCCKDMYSCRNGVSEYILQMEQLADQGKYRIPLWDDDYKLLKHLRWIRNQIAHDSHGIQFCKPHDVDAIQNFYNRLLSGQDPLALLRKSTETPPCKRGTVPYRHKKDRASATVALTISIIGLIAAAIILFYFAAC